MGGKALILRRVTSKIISFKLIVIFPTIWRWKDCLTPHEIVGIKVLWIVHDKDWFIFFHLWVRHSRIKQWCSVPLCRKPPLINPLAPKSDQHLTSPYYNDHSWVKHESHENRTDDHQLEQLLTVKQILLVSLFRNVWRTVWRICILILRCKDLHVTSTY